MKISRTSVIIVVCVSGLLGVLWVAQSYRGSMGSGSDSGGGALPEHFRPQRIICMSPGITESVFALGAGDRVVGVADFTVYPPEAADKERVGGYMNPNLEKLLALQPDLIIVQGRAEKISRFCEHHDIALSRVQNDDIDGIMNTLRQLGDVLGCAEQAQRLCEEITRCLEQLRTRLGDSRSRRVFICIDRPRGSLRDMYTAGPNTFISELVTLAGGENIFADVAQNYPQISKESLQIRQPEIILEPQAEVNLSPEALEQRKADWQRMPELPAVQTGRIYFPADDYLLIPGPRVTLAALRIAQILHPERFSP